MSYSSETVLQLLKHTLTSNCLLTLSNKLPGLIDNPVLLKVIKNSDNDNGTGKEALYKAIELLQAIQTILKLIQPNFITNCDNVPLDKVLQLVRDVLDGKNVDIIVQDEGLAILRELCRISCNYGSSSLLQSLANCFLYYIHLAHSDRKYVIVIDNILDSFIQKADENIQSQFDKYIEPHLQINEVDFFINTLVGNDVTSNLRGIVMLNTLPNYVKFFKKLDLTENLWLALLLRSKFDWEEFACLRSLLEIIISCNKDEMFLNIVENEYLWRFIQQGLRHSQYVVRKQSLTLLKVIVKEIAKRKIMVKSKRIEEISGDKFQEKLDEGAIRFKNGLKNVFCSGQKLFYVESNQSYIFWWDPVFNKQLDLLFDDMCIVFESVEEKQSHIVQPALNALIKLSDNVLVATEKNHLHPSWVFTMCYRFLQHDNVSIAKSALSFLMQCNIDSYPSEESFSEALTLIFQHLPNSNLYINEFQNELADFFERASTAKRRFEFFKIFITFISELKWNPEALFFTLNAALSAKPAQFLSKNEMNLVKNLVHTGITTMYTYLRSAIQCTILQLITTFSEPSSLELIADVLSVFRFSDCLVRGTRTWNDLVKWLSFVFSKREAQQYLIEHLPVMDSNPKKTTLMLVLLYDAELFGVMQCCGGRPSSGIIQVLHDTFGYFKDANKRLYLNLEPSEHKLSLVQLLLQVHNNQTSAILELILPYFGDILDYLLARLREISIRVSDSVDRALKYLDVFGLIIQTKKLYKIDLKPFLTGSGRWLEYSMDQLILAGDPLQKYIAAAVFAIILQQFHTEASLWNSKLFYYFQNNLNGTLTRPESCHINPAVWGSLNTEYLKNKYLIFKEAQNQYLVTKTDEALSVTQLMKSQKIIDSCTEILSITGSNILPVVMEIAATALTEISESDRVIFVSTCWTSLMETRRNDMFLPSAEAFIKMLFQKSLIDGTINKTIFVEYAKYLLSESINGLANAFMKHLQFLKIDLSVSETMSMWCQILANALLFGAIIKREDRLTIAACGIASKLPYSTNQLFTNQWATSSEVRARAVQIIAALKKDVHTGFAGDLASTIIKHENELNKNRKRYFENSQTHVYRTRALQSLLILSPVLTHEDKEFVFDWICHKFLKDSQQISVRYLYEYFVFLFFFESRSIYSSALETYKEVAKESGVASQCSLISILFLLGKTTALFSEFSRCVDDIVPYCFGQHFQTRLYSQVACFKLLQKFFEDSQTCDTPEKEAFAKNYAVIYKNLQQCIECEISKSTKNIKLNEDFYFTVFTPFAQFSLKTILYDLPRLAYVKNDELIPVDLLKECGISDGGSNSIDLEPSCTLLSECECSTANRQVPNYFIEEQDDSQQNIQKKMIPTKSILPDLEALFSMVKIDNKTEGLIVVGSLLDRGANLGGLVRTCEIFGVTEFIVNTLQIVNDPQFQGLSVTAEKWIRFTEVKSHMLQDYLLRKKREGYSVVGAEQTIQSTLLQNTVFSRKTILVLGNEKEGLPAKFLPLLDQCVEIPQLGFVRSLNVHVTGALFIWEYTKQHGLRG